MADRVWILFAPGLGAHAPLRNRRPGECFGETSGGKLHCCALAYSASADFIWLQEIFFGFDVVRGSSSRIGAAAGLELSNVLSSGHDVLITPDGPRGPAYALGPGIIFLAQKTGAPVVPVNMEYSSCWRVKSWDRFIIPRPFSKVRVIIGQPQQVRSTSTPEEFESERLRLQNAMMSLVERR